MRPPLPCRPRRAATLPLLCLLSAWLLAPLTSAADFPRIRLTTTVPPEARTELQRKYPDTLKALDLQRKALRTRYDAAKSASARSAIISEARTKLLTSLLHDLLPAWDGTPWDFNGTSETPGQGIIACGYFVTTTLRDAGFKLPRIRLAQQPSQRIIRSLCEPGTIRVYYQRPLGELSQYLRAHGPGLYVVGLDCHTGFVAFDGETESFIHASYYKVPRAVLSEPLSGPNPLSGSRYRMIGRLLDDALVRKWLRQESIPMVASRS